MRFFSEKYFLANLLLTKASSCKVFDFSQSLLLLVKVVLRRTMGVVGWSGGGGGHAVTRIEHGTEGACMNKNAHFCGDLFFFFQKLIIVSK